LRSCIFGYLLELSNGDFPGSEEQARKTQEKRDLILRRAEAKTKQVCVRKRVLLRVIVRMFATSTYNNCAAILQLIAHHHQKEAEAKEKEAVRQEKLKELTKERKVFFMWACAFVFQRTIITLNFKELFANISARKRTRH